MGPGTGFAAVSETDGSARLDVDADDIVPQEPLLQAFVFLALHVLSQPICELEHIGGDLVGRPGCIAQMLQHLAESLSLLAVFFDEAALPLFTPGVDLSQSSREMDILPLHVPGKRLQELFACVPQASRLVGRALLDRSS